MMIAPETFKEEHIHDSLEECLHIRREIIEDILNYENGNVPESEYMIMPSPDTRYHMNNLYLIEICKLIEEKQMEEDEDEEEYMGNQDNLIYSFDSRVFMTQSGYNIKIYDTTGENTVISYYSLTDNKPHAFTLSENEINSIKKLIAESSLVFNDDEIEMGNMGILDGSTETVFIHNGSKTVSFDIDNLYFRYDGFADSTKGGQLYRMCSTIENILVDKGMLQIDEDEEDE